MMVTTTKIKKCPKCGEADKLYEDEDGLACLCGWHDYGEIPDFIVVGNVECGYSWGHYRDRGCVYATKKLGKQSRCIDCPYTEECIFIKGKRRQPKY